MPDKGKNDNHSDTMVFYPPAAVIGLGSKARNWCLSGRARGQCVTVLSVVRSAPAAARNGTGQFSVLNDKFQFVPLFLPAAVFPPGPVARKIRHERTTVRDKSIQKIMAKFVK